MTGFAQPSQNLCREKQAPTISLIRRQDLTERQLGGWRVSQYAWLFVKADVAYLGHLAPREWHDGQERRQTLRNEPFASPGSVNHVTIDWIEFFPVSTRFQLPFVLGRPGQNPPARILS